MEDTISLIEIFKTLKKRWKLIVLMTLIATLISIVVTYFVLTPVYQASTQILVNQKNTENQLDIYQINSNVELINTYGVILKSPAILDKVIEELELTQSVEGLNNNISVSSQGNSQVFTVTVKNEHEDKAVEIANTVSETFQQEIQDIMNVDNVSILAKAELSKDPSPVNPKPILNIAIAIAVGLMAGIGLAFLLEYLDYTLKVDSDIEDYLGLPVLGSIEIISQKGTKSNKSIQKIGGETLES